DSDTGDSDLDLVTAENPVTLSGTAEPYAFIELFDASAPTKALGKAVQADAFGEWTATVQLPQEGVRTLVARATDLAGNVSDASGELKMTLDQTPPPVPSQLGLEEPTDTGDSPLDGLTKVDPPTIKGVGEQGTRIEVYNGDTLLGTTVVNADNSWSFTPEAPLAEGTHSITALAIDLAGNKSAASGPLTITVDQAGPRDTTIEPLTLASDSGVQGDNLTNVVQPRFSGQAEAYATVELFDGTTSLGTTRADGQGDWTLDLQTLGVAPLAEGLHSITAQATDGAGNLGPKSSPLAITIDTTLPEAPGAIDLETASDSGRLPDDNLTNLATTVLTGTAEPLSTITLLAGTTPVETVSGAPIVADAQGRWTAEVNLDEGDVVLTATATDAAGNTGPASPALVLTLDRTAPAAPGDMALVAGSDSGRQGDDRTLTQQPFISGSAEAFAEVELFDGVGGPSLGKVYADSEGLWQLQTSKLAEGEHQIVAQATDVAGNVSTLSLPVVVTIDVTGPQDTVITGITEATDSGESAIDQLTNNTRPVLVGTTEARARVDVYDGSKLIGSAVADDDGAWTLDLATVDGFAGLAEGARNLAAVATDETGNPGKRSEVKVVTIDTTAPTARPVMIGLEASSDTGLSPVDSITNETLPTVRGTAPAGTLVNVYNGDVLLGRATFEPDGKTWRYTLTEEQRLADGSYAITARIQDLAGNEGPGASPARSIRVDTIAPDVPTLGAPLLVTGSDTGRAGEDAVTGGLTPMVTGRLTVPADTPATDRPVIEVFVDGQAVGRTHVNIDGSWTFVVPATATPAQDGILEVKARALDVAGNASEFTAPVLVTVDRQTPSSPVVLGLTPATDSGQADSITNQASPTLQGTAEPNATVVLVLDGVTKLGPIVASATGEWTVEVPGLLADGAHTVTAVALDAAGNLSGVSAARTFVVDAAAPAAPTLGLAVGSDNGLNPFDLVTMDADPTLVGTAEPLASVQVFEGTELLGTATADLQGRWSLQVPARLPGSHTFKAIAMDVAGNVGAESAALTIEVDTVAPAAPTLTALATSGQTLTGADLVTFNARPVLAGTGEAGAVVQVYDGDTLVGQARVDGSGAWSLLPTKALTPGAHALTAKVLDAAGNASADSNALNVTVDAAPPGAPTVLGVATDAGTATVSNLLQPILKGNAEAGAKVDVYDGATLLGSTVSDETGEWTFRPATELTEGPHDLLAFATDKAGNQSWSAAPTQVLLDRTAPATPPTILGLDPASDSGDDPRDAITAKASPQLVGTAEPGTTVELFYGAKSGTTTTGADGVWRFTPEALAEGLTVFTAVARDAAGNATKMSAGYSVTVDQTAPDAAVVTSLAPVDGSQTGPSAWVTRNAFPTLVGTSEAGARIDIYQDQTLLGSTTADATGTWRYRPATAMPEGVATLRAEAVDQAGNAAAATTFTVTIDSQPPVSRPTLGLALASDTGASTTDAVTRLETPTFVGTADANATVRIVAGANVLGTVKADATGAWSLTLPAAGKLAEGAHVVTVVAEDAGGNLSVPSVPMVVRVDLSAPAAPVILGLTTATDSGASPLDGFTNDPNPVLRGTAEPGASIAVQAASGQALAVVTADASGFWQVPVNLPEGRYEFTAVATDLAGNPGAASTKATISLDRTEPAVPTITGLGGTTDTGLNTSDGVTRNDRPLIVGKAEAFSTVQVYEGTRILGSTLADSLGNWSLNLVSPLTPGEHILSAASVDLAGNSRAAAGTFTVMVDITPPTAPKAIALGPGADTGVSAADGLTNAVMPKIQGTAEPLARIEVYDGAQSLGFTSADATGAWTFTPTKALLPGSHSIAAVAYDEAGNPSGLAAPLTIVIDATAPAAPELLGISPDSGASPADGITRVGTATLAGKAEPNAIIEIFDNGEATPIGTVKANQVGAWEFTPETALAEGQHALSAVAIDAAGNRSAPSPAMTVTVDTLITEAATITGLSATTDSGTSATDHVTQNPRPTIEGTAEPGSLVRVFAGTTELGTTQADGAGEWAFTPSTELAAGLHAITAVFTDPAGNTSPSSTALNVRVAPSSGALAAPTAALPLDQDTGLSQTDGITRFDRPVLSGTGTPGMMVELFEGTTRLGSDTVSITGKWTVAPTDPLSDGRHALSVRISDASGNFSATSQPVVVEVDTTAPSPPQVRGLAPGDDTGPSSTDGVTSLSMPQIIGTGEAGTLVDVYINGVAVKTVPVATDGTWAYTLDASLAVGESAVQARAIDRAGNIGAMSTAFVVTYDGVRPPAPVITGLSAESDTGASQADAVTNAVAPTFLGTAEAFNTIQIFRDGQRIGATAADEKGSWTFTPIEPFAPGKHQITAQSTDRAGNSKMGEYSAPLTLEVITAAPEAPTLAGLTAGTDTGTVGDNRTANRTPGFHGTSTAPAGTLIELYDGPERLGSTTVQADGTWTFTWTSTLGLGVHPIRAVAVDRAGNASLASAVVPVTIDTAGPGAPTILRLGEGGVPLVPTDTGRNDADRITNNQTPVLVGFAEPGTTVNVYSGLKLVATGVTDAEGNWTATANTLDAGSHTLTAVAVDGTGNPGSESAPFTVVVDTSVPDAAVFTGLSAATDTGVSQTDSITAINKPVLTGTAEPRATVEVFQGDTRLGVTLANADGKWTLPVTLGVDDPSGTIHQLKARTIDAAGNASAFEDFATEIVIDQRGPGVPTSLVLDAGSDTGSVGDNITSAQRPTIRGKADPGVRVEVYDGETNIGFTIADDGTGAWTFTPQNLLPVGSRQISARAVDLAGNTSASSLPLPLTIDAGAPGAPVIQGLTVEPASGQHTDTGFSPADNRTQELRPVLRGTAEPFSRVIVTDTYDGSSTNTTVTTDETGVWTFRPSEDLGEGNHTFTARALDQANNISATSKSLLVRVDVTAPAAPEDIRLLPTMDSGASASDGVTQVTRPTISGRVEAGAVVDVFYVDAAAGKDVLLGSVVANASGDWQFALPMTFKDGVHSLKARATDAAGNEGGLTAPVAFTVDTVAPDAPSIDGITAISDTGAEGDALTANPAPTLTGKATPGSTITLYDGPTVLATGILATDGTWSFAPTLATGRHAITAVATDLAGNPSEASAAFVVTIDDVAPGGPTLTGLESPGDTGRSSSDLVTSARTPTLVGRAEPGTLVRIYDDGSPLDAGVEIKADATGAWKHTVSAPLGDGVHRLTFTATDAAGSEGAASAVYELEIDTAAPLAPVLSGLTAATDTGISPTDAITRDTRPTIVGTAEPDATVEIFDNGALLGTTTADAAGAWSFVPAAALLPGVPHELSAVARDAAGNLGPSSVTTSLVVDITPPTAPTITGLTPDTDTGFSQVDGVTSDIKPTLTGTAEPGARVTIYGTGSVTPIATVDADELTGDWSYTFKASLPEGATTYTARAVDKAGNESLASSPFTVTYDAASDAPTILGLSTGTDTGSSALDFVTRVAAPGFVGKAPVGSKVTVYAGTTAVGTAITDANGEWTVVLEADLPEGVHDVTATAESRGGRLTTSASVTLNVDLSPPAAPTDVGLDPASDTGDKGDGITTTLKPSITGVGTPGETIQLLVGDTVIGSGKADGTTGRWTIATSLSGTTNTVSVRAIDLAGNVGEAADYTFQIAPTSAVAPTLRLSPDTDLGVSGSDAITSATSLQLTGFAQPGQVVTVKEGGVEIGTATASSTGAWSLAVPGTAAEGTYTYTASVEDAFGNVGTSSALSVDVDTTEATVVGVTGSPAGTATVAKTVNPDGSKVTITVKLSEDVYVDTSGGVPSLRLETGATDREAVYTGYTASSTAPPGAGTSLEFSYIPRPGEEATRLNYTDLSALALNGAVIRDRAGNVVNLDLPDPSDLVNSLAGSNIKLGTNTGTKIANVYAKIVGVDDGGGNVASLVPVDPNTGKADARPTLIGIAAPGVLTVDIYDGKTKLSDTPVAVDADGNFTFELPTDITTFTAGGKSFGVKPVSDTAGTNFDKTAAVTTLIDFQYNAKPGAPKVLAATDTGISDKDAVTADAFPTFTGTLTQSTADQAAFVTIYDGATVLGKSYMGTKTSGWTFTPAQALAEGTHIITAVATDIYGREGGSSPALTLVIDQSGPSGAPTVLGLDQATTNDTGAIGDNTTKVTKPKIRVEGVAVGDYVTIYNGDEIVAKPVKVTTAPGGKATILLTSDLPNGVHNLSAVVSDAAGNTSERSAEVPITINKASGTTLTTGAPNFTFLGLDAASDSGISRTDGTTNNVRPTLVGTGTPGLLLRVSETVGKTTTVLGYATVDETGRWALPFPESKPSLEPGSRTFTVVSAPSETHTGVLTGAGLDVAGNTVVISAGGVNSQTVTVDTTTPLVSGITAPTGSYVAGDTIPIAVKFDRAVYVDTSTGLPSLALETGETKREAIYTGGSGTDTLTFTYAVQPGDVASRLTYVAQDPLQANGATLQSKAGTTASLAVATLTAPTDATTSLVNKSANQILIDTLPPEAAPAFVGLGAGTDTGFSETDGVTSNARPSIEITATMAPGEQLVVVNASKGDQVVFSGVPAAVAGKPGVFSFTPAADLEPGTHVFVARAKDSLGNATEPSTPFTVVIDRAAPSSATLEGLTPDTDTGSVATDGVTSSVVPVVRGTAEPGARVALELGGETLTTTASATGAWSFALKAPVALVEGSNAYTVTVTDLAGNVNLVSATATLQLDTEVPGAPTVVGLDPASDSGPDDGITNVARPTLVGTVPSAEATGLRVEVFDNGVLLGTTSTTSTTWAFTPATPLGPGSHSITARVTDLAGNVSTLSGAASFTIDGYAAPPVLEGITAASDTGVLTNDGITANARPTFTGTAEPLGTVSLFDGTSPAAFATAPVNADGTWSYTPTTPLKTGLREITATVTDPSGTTSARSAMRPVVIDPDAPSAPAFDTILTSTGTLAPASKLTTRDKNPVVYGLSEPGAAVDVTVGEAAPVTLTADANGRWFLPLTLVEGETTITARATDAAGNEGASSAPLTLVVDSARPETPPVPVLDPASDLGASKTDLITSDTSPTFTGVVEANALVRVFGQLGDNPVVALGTTRADSFGAWSFTAPLLEAGKHSITIRATDNAGNESDTSGALVFTIDTTPPGAPSIKGLTEDTDTGVSTTDGLTRNAQPVLQGLGEEGTTIQVTDGVTTWTVPVQPGGTWELDLSALENPSLTPLSSGSHPFRAIAIDKAGNRSSVSELFVTTVDTVAPTTPAITGLTVATDTGNNATDGITSNARPVIQGTGEAGTRLTVYDGDKALGTVEVGYDGRWQLATNEYLAPGTHTLTAHAEDAAGNLSPASASRVIEILDTRPAEPLITGLTDATDTGATGDGVTAIITPTLAGTAVPNGVISIFEGGAMLGTAVADASGAWTFQAPEALSEGRHTFTARVKDPAGNVSAESQPYTIAVDLTSPGVPALTGFLPGSDTGDDKDGITSQTEPTLYGTAEPGATVYLYDGATRFETKADAAGAWAITPTLAPGQHVIAVQAVDGAGNAGPVTPLRTVVIDTVAPIAPTVSGLTPDTDTGLSSTDGVTSTATPTFVGVAEPGTSVQLLAEGKLLGEAVAGDDGSWRIALAEERALPAGVQLITARAIDIAANESTLSAPLRVTVDPVEASAPVIAGISSATDTGAVSDDAVTRVKAPTLIGKADPDALIRIFEVVGGVQVAMGATAADAAGDWSFVVPSALSDGSHTFTATATSRAGLGDKVALAPFTVTIDTLPDATPTVTGLKPEVESDSGVLGDQLTSVTLPTLVGTAAPNARLVVFDGTTRLGDTTADADGAWSLALISPLAQGSHMITAVAEDLAGNVSATSVARGLVIDTQAPDRPVILGLTPGTDTGASNYDGATSNLRPTITGMAEGHAVLELYDNNVLVASGIQANAAGFWSHAFADDLGAGSHEIRVVAVDRAGNRSALSDLTARSTIQIIDSVPTGVPTLEGLTKDTDTGFSNTDGLTLNTRPTIVGSADPNSTVTLYDTDGKGNKALLGVTNADAAGRWTFTPLAPLAQGSHGLSATQTDLVGNTSGESATLPIVIDLKAPTAPQITGLAAGSDTGVSATDGLTALTQPTIVGKAGANQLVRVYDGTQVLDTVQADASGQWTLDLAAAVGAPALGAGSHELTAIAINEAGNVSDASGVFSVLIDPNAPGAPVVRGLSATSDTGRSATDGITSVAQPTLVGAAEPGASVRIYETLLDGTQVTLGTVSAREDGSWSLALKSDLAVGKHAISAAATDAAGNVSATSAAAIVEIDGAAPDAPSLTGLSADSQTGLVGDDPLTRFNQVTVLGKAEANAVVELRNGVTPLGTALADGQGNWSATVTLTDSKSVLTATATDAAGRTSTAASNTLTVYVDQAAPAAPTFKAPVLTALTDSATVGDGVTVVQRPTFIGTAGSGETVILREGDTILGTAKADATGAWQITPTTDLTPGSHAIYAQTRDDAGNFSAPTPTQTVVIDVQAPGAPVVLGLSLQSPDGSGTTNITTDTGTNPYDGVTKETRPILVGTAEPGAVVAIYDTPAATGTQALLGTVAADARGVWTLDLRSPSLPALTVDSHAITAQATDRAGNTSEAAVARTITVLPPLGATPEVSRILPEFDTGSSDTDGLTRSARPTLEGTAAPNSSVEVYDTTVLAGKVLLGTVRADETGAWRFLPAVDLADGTHAISARALDAAGNFATSTGSFSLRIDRTAPVLPAITRVETVNNGVTSLIPDGGLSRATSHTVKGTGETNSLVELFDGETKLGEAVVVAGAWSIVTTGLATGAHALRVVSTDAAGNSSQSAAPRVIAVDTGAPPAPVIFGLTPATDNGQSDTDGITTETLPVLRGSAVPGATVEIYDAGTRIGVTAVTADGTWAFTPTNRLTAGTHSITAKAVSAAGVSSEASSAFTLVIDAVAPGAPQVLGLDPGTDTALADHVTAVRAPVILGQNAQPNGRVLVLDGGKAFGSEEASTVVADATGAWRFQVPADLNDGDHLITAVSLDSAGNRSNPSPTFKIGIDSTAPLAPAKLALTPATDSGASTTDGLTNRVDPVLTGTAEIGTTVTILAGGATDAGSLTVLGTATPDATGKWSYTLPLSEGVTNVTASSADVAGNTSPAGPFLSVIVDLTAPAAPTIRGLAPTTDNGTATEPDSDTDARTAVARPTLIGAAEAGAALQIFDGDKLIGTAKADDAGQWSFTPAADLTQGTHAITLKATDAAGNVSDASEALNVVIEAPAPVGYRLGAQAVGGLWLGDFEGASGEAVTYMAAPAPAIALGDLLVQGDHAELTAWLQDPAAAGRQWAREEDPGKGPEPPVTVPPELQPPMLHHEVWREVF
ncbi:MAG: Ig-like domain-containing protein, partial [Candidatus Sericytochromatia bacterium]|nr:Ig-like domain-containing protein [Candidatus Sericytochromatia bacterium]